MGILKQIEERALSAYPQEDLFTRKRAGILLYLNLVLLSTGCIFTLPVHLAIFRERPLLAPGDLLLTLGMVASLLLLRRGRLGLAGTISITASLLTPLIHNVLGDLWQPEQGQVHRYFETILFISFLFPIIASYAIRWPQILGSAVASCGIILAHFFVLRYRCGVQIPADSLIYLIMVVIAGTFGIITLQVTHASIRSLEASRSRMAAWNRNLEQVVEIRTRELQSLNRTLEAMSLTDGLTGIANRRKFDATFEAEWNRAIRTDTPLALLLMDLDQFKAYNDELGHQAGDHCLQQIARTMAECLQRSGELVARYGGEEFVALLPGADRAEAFRQAERIRTSVEGLAIPHPTGTPEGIMTVSIGISAHPLSEMDSQEGYLREADQALYSAKHQGRNCSVVAT
ncbi:MAG: diguanylate cyclase [Holophagaceae bacterium]|nr:diguanylate cyclase [Holophagaceae bacterium]